MIIPPRRISRGVAVCVILMAFIGCQESVEVTPVTPPPPTPAKSILSEVAQSGELGSAASSIRDALTQLKETDAAKADELLKDLDELETMSTPDKIKAQAKKMADKL